jgi:hypothetical protein
MTSNFIDDYERVYFSHWISAKIRANHANIIEKKMLGNIVLLIKFVSRHVSILVEVAHSR